MAKHHYQRLSLTPSKPPSRRDHGQRSIARSTHGQTATGPCARSSSWPWRGAVPDVTYSTARP